MNIEQVKQLQRDLQGLGLYEGIDDGDWGPKSRAAWTAAMLLLAKVARPPLTTGPDGIAVMHAFEGCRLTAYPDPATGGDPWTVGWGDTGPDVVRGLTITQAEADTRFARRLAREFEPAVRAMLKVEVSQRQFDALVSWVYNVGVGNASGSTLMRKLNAGDAAGAADQFLLWDKAGGRAMLGLKRRRTAERALFLGRSGAEAVAIGRAVQA